MTTQLTKSQIQALKVELAQYGLEIRPAPKPRIKSHLSAIRAWKPETAAGRACKSAMLKYASLPPIVGVTSHFKLTGQACRSNHPAKIAEFYKAPWLNQYQPQNLLLTFKATPRGKQVYEKAQYRSAA